MGTRKTKNDTGQVVSPTPKPGCKLGSELDVVPELQSQLLGRPRLEDGVSLHVFSWPEPHSETPS